MEGEDALLGPGATALKLLGLWPLRGRGGRLLSALLAAGTLVSLALLVVCVILKLYADPPVELEEITLCGLVISLCVGFILKAGLFLAQAGTLRQMLRLLADTMEQFQTGDSNKLTRHRYQKLSKNIYFYFQIMAVPAVIGWVLSPVVSNSIASSDHEQMVAHRTFPVPVWLPEDFYMSPTYEILYAVNAFWALLTTECGLVVDIFFVHVMLMIAAEFEVLNDNLSAMGHLQMMRTDTETFISRYEMNDSRLAVLNTGQSLGEQRIAENAAYEWIHRQLVKNVLHHQAILRSVSLLQTAMDVSIFIFLFIDMANLCCSIFVAVVLFQREGNLGKSLNALLTIPALLYETVVYCIYAHIMTDQSERLVYSAYKCAWVNSDARFKRSLIIFMTATMHPTVITLGKTCTLSKQMLIQVLNGTYGLLNMLYQMNSM